MAIHPNPIRTPYPVVPRPARTQRPAAGSADRKPPGAAEILLVFVAVICVMVVTVTALTLVNRWWALIPAFLIAVACEVAVFGTIRHLLADDE